MAQLKDQGVGEFALRNSTEGVAQREGEEQMLETGSNKLPERPRRQAAMVGKNYTGRTANRTVCYCICDLGH